MLAEVLFSIKRIAGRLSFTTFPRIFWFPENWIRRRDKPALKFGIQGLVSNIREIPGKGLRFGRAFSLHSSCVSAAHENLGIPIPRGVSNWQALRK